jgi:hypothetical protein
MFSALDMLELVSVIAKDCLFCYIIIEAVG